MKKILVSLISEQTVPNVIVAEHFMPDVYWFLSTKRMESEGKRRCVENALMLKKHNLTLGNTLIKIVDQDSLADCIEKIEEMINMVNEESSYIVNITGGNKIMAIAALEVFRDIGEKVIIGYVPLNKNDFIQIYPRKKPLRVHEISARLSVEEYLSCYGFEIRNKGQIQSSISTAIRRELLSRWILDNYEELKGMLRFLYKNIGNKRNEAQVEMLSEFNREPSGVEREFLKRLSFTLENKIIKKILTRDEIIYLTGGWFEEYAFSEIYKMLQRDFIDDVKIGIQVSSISGTDNELDIAFMKNNTFYHIECKTLGEEEEQFVVRDEVYKKGAILHQLGKGGNAFICTTHNSIKPSLLNRARDYNVIILNLNDVRNLSEEISKQIR